MNLQFDGDRIGRFGANFVASGSRKTGRSATAVDIAETYQFTMRTSGQRLDCFIAEWNRQQAAPNAKRVAKRHTLMTLIRHARQCRDYFWRPCCLQLRLSAPTAPSP